MKRGYTLPEILMSAGLFSLLLVVLSGSFITIRKVSLARTRRLESRLPLLQANEKLAGDLNASGADGVVVGPDLISICVKNGVTSAGKVDWSAGLVLWSWSASAHSLRVYRLDMTAARAAGFNGDGAEPLCPKMADLQAYVAGASASQEYPLGNCTFVLTPQGQVEWELEARHYGGDPFRLSRTVGFRL